MAFVAAAIPLITAAAGMYMQNQQQGKAARDASNAARMGGSGGGGFTPTAIGASQTLKDVLGAGKRDFAAPERPEMIDSGVGKSGMGDAPAQGMRLKQALEMEGNPDAGKFSSGPSAVEGLDAGPEKFAQMNNPAMGAGPKAASSPSWLNADTIGTAAQVAGALASSGGGPPSAGLPNVGSMNYTPTVTRLQQALGRSPQRF